MMFSRYSLSAVNSLVLICCALAANTELLELVHPLLYSTQIVTFNETASLESMNISLLAEAIIRSTGSSQNCSEAAADSLYSANEQIPTESVLVSAWVWFWFTLVTLFTKMAQWYGASLESNPIFTKSITAGCIAAMGDVLAQCLDLGGSDESEEEEVQYRNDNDQNINNNKPKNRPSISLRRVCSIAAEGIFVSGPLMHLGYEILEQYFPIFAEESETLYHPWTMTMCQVFVDMFIMDTFFVGTMMITGAFLEGRKHQILDELCTSYVPAVRVSWLSSFCFLPLQCMTFKYIPLYYRVAAVNFQDIAWNTAVSYMTHRPRQDKDDTDVLDVDATKIGAITDKPKTIPTTIKSES